MPISSINGKEKTIQNPATKGITILNPFVHKLELNDPVEKLKVSI